MTKITYVFQVTETVTHECEITLEVPEDEMAHQYESEAERLLDNLITEGRWKDTISYSEEPDVVLDHLLYDIEEVD